MPQLREDLPEHQIEENWDLPTSPINTEQPETVYVVYWVDLDDDCLKKSIIEVVGVYKNISDAEDIAKEINEKKEGYCDDSRCYYASVSKVEVNITVEKFKEYAYDDE